MANSSSLVSLVTVSIDDKPVFERFRHGANLGGLMPNKADQLKVKAALEDALLNLDAQISRWDSPNLDG